MIKIIYVNPCRRRENKLKKMYCCVEVDPSHRLYSNNIFPLQSYYNSKEFSGCPLTNMFGICNALSDDTFSLLEVKMS